MVHATQAVAMFHRLAVKHGAEVRDRTKVVAITPFSGSGGSGGGGGSGGVRITTARGDTVTAESCVVTCGAWYGLAHIARHVIQRILNPRF